MEAVEKYLGSLSSRGMEEGLLKELHAKVEGLKGVHIPCGQMVGLAAGSTPVEDREVVGMKILFEFASDLLTIDLWPGARCFCSLCCRPLPFDQLCGT